MNLSKTGKSGYLLAVLVLLGALLSACTASGEFTPAATANGARATPTVQPVSSGGNRVEVVYFHRTKRCYTCQYAGDATQHTVETYFGNELASGELVFRMLDVQDAANADTVKRYEAYGTSLFMNEVVDGVDHIEQVTDIWYHVGDDEEFVDVVRSAIDKHLENI